MPASINRLAAVAAVVAALLSLQAEARGGHRNSDFCTSCARDSHGRIARSLEAREQFMRETGYPHGRPGYVIDHIVPLKRGGPDVPSNMQWQTEAEARAKDKWE
jgi:hypothetical protein